MSQMSFGGDWTQQKLEILAGYLNAYTSVLKNQPFTLTYVDAFAGEGFWRPNGAYGEEEYGDFRNFLEGSAKIAIDVTDRPFDRLIFIEKNYERSRSLLSLRQDYADRDIDVRNEDANGALPNICNGLGAFDRAVVFLDPFATQVSWSTVASLATTQKIDCWILFPLSAVTRMMPTSGLPLPGWDRSLDRIFGGREYWKDFYQVSRQLSFLDDGPRQERPRGNRQIAARYRERLESVFYRVAPTSRTFTNSRRSAMFELFFAASNANGARRAIPIASHLLDHW